VVGAACSGRYRSVADRGRRAHHAAVVSASGGCPLESRVLVTCERDCYFSRRCRSPAAAGADPTSGLWRRRCRHRLGALAGQPRPGADQSNDGPLHHPSDSQCSRTQIEHRRRRGPQHPGRNRQRRDQHPSERAGDLPYRRRWVSVRHGPTWLVLGRRRRCCSQNPSRAHLRARSSERLGVALPAPGRRPRAAHLGCASWIRSTARR